MFEEIAKRVADQKVKAYYSDADADRAMKDREELVAIASLMRDALVLHESRGHYYVLEGDRIVCVGCRALDR